MNHAERRIELGEAALRLISEEGIEAATMRRLAAAAGCTTGAVTHYFANREDLLVFMLRRAHEAAGQRMVAAVSRETTPLARLRAVIDEALPLDATRFREWRVWLAFWSAIPGSAALAEEHVKRTAEWSSVLEALVAETGLPGPEAKSLHAQLLGLIDGYGLQIALCPSTKSKRSADVKNACRAALDATLRSAGLF